MSVMDKQDHIYIEKILNGETGVFSLLVQKYSQKTFHLIQNIVHDRQDAEELTQDCFLKAFHHLSRFKGECRFSTWLYRIAYTTAISAVRKKRREYVFVDEESIDRVPDQEVDRQFERDMQSEQLEALQKALNLLPPEEKAILLLFYSEQKSTQEIATITGLSPANVKIKLYRLRKKLYVMLDPKGKN